MLKQDAIYVIQLYNLMITMADCEALFIIVNFCMYCAYQADARIRADKKHLELFEPRFCSVCEVQIREVNRRGKAATRVSKANLLANS
jgi:hypothetical protein